MIPRLLILLCVVLLASCALKEKLSPYRLEIQQGHLLAPEAVAKLKTGMAKEQVRFLLGTPLINDLFNPDRLYYIYRNQKGDGPVEKANLTLYFAQNKLVRVDTDLIPRPAVALAATESPVKNEAAGKVTPTAVQPAATTEQEAAAPAKVPVPFAARQTVSIQPPVQAAARPIALSDEKLVAQTIRDWLQAWRKQDVEAYLAFYAKQFKTPDNEPRSQWEQTRRTRVLRPRKIEIRLSALKLQIADTGNATAIFRQDYRSDSYGDKVIKDLTFIKEDGVWRIRQERVVKANG